MSLHKFFSITALALIFCGAFAPALSAQTEQGWVLADEKDGVKIYHQTTPGMMHVKLSTTLKASMSGIATLFSEVETYPVWGYKVAESKLLKRVSPTEMYYYSKFDFPWPMDDRDIVLHSVLVQDPTTRRITITNTPMPDYSPAVKGVTRIRNSKTKWTITPGSNGTLNVEQQISTDSGSNMPDWLVKMTVDTGPRETIKGIKKILVQQHYQSAKLAHIKD
ncbi:MAG: START domain-containing protein [Saprospiraceae bacterium]